MGSPVIWSILRLNERGQVMSVSIEASHVVKRYEQNTIIPDLSVKINNGEFFTLLGPSGCGKTTLLRMIVGFNSIEDGVIQFDDKIINDIPTYKRNIGMVFQNYAIFPHMTVRENVEYGLKLRKEPKESMKRKVDEILKMVKIYDYQDRLPERLSGGQQQRVALARAIVIHPSVLLMDEPLSNLDAKLRVEMRSAIREVQRQVGITTVYVTHDQEEALAISDRIAIMNHGVIQQIGKPQDIYQRPANVFVSTFIGHSNLLKATIQIDEGQTSLLFPGGFRIAMNNLADVEHGQKVVVSVRPEEFSPSEGLAARIIDRTFLGKYTNYVLEFAEELIIPGQASIEFSQDHGQTEQIFEIGDMVSLRPNPAKINVFTEDMEHSLIKDVKKYE